jgi:multidrug resistance efflux pump
MLDRVERQRVVAPATGVIAAFSGRAVGSHVRAQESLLTLTPDGPIRVVARFAPGDAAARIRVGQRARLRPPATPEGGRDVVDLVVAGVGTVLREGTIEVELVPGSAVSLASGSVGRVEVVVGMAPPWRLLFGAAP